MERPRRNPRPPGALSDYLTVVEPEEKSIYVEESIGEQQQQQQQEEKQEKQMEAKDTSQTEVDRKFLLSQPYKCRECKACYRSRVALLRHAVKHSGEKPFVCCECGRGLSSQCALTEHMNIHTNNRPHRCEECGLESRQLSVHLRHMLTHQAQPQHKCSVCSRSFKQNEYLKKHMRKHTGEKPFVCELCSKSFTCKSELNRHSKRHSSERPHSCADCGKSFKMRHNLHKHLRAHAGTQQWKCLMCSAVFSKLKLLEEHKRSHLETVQQLQISRPDDSVLVISAEGDDRRKLPTVHTIMVPKESLIAENSDVNSKKHLRINGTSLPLELILKSVAKGGNIKIKIIDKPAQPRIQSCATTENIVELVDEDANKPGGLSLSKDSTHHLQETSSTQDSAMQSVNQEAVKVASVLSVPASIQSHCLSKHYHQVSPACSDYCCWLATFVSFCQQLCPPFDPEICKHLSFMTTALQNCLVQQPDSSKISQMGELGSALTCHTHTQYQFIYKQYRAVQEILTTHFAHYITDAN
ncbi:hypothetical protein O3P69_009458 [Scylla paramamosain]|uniref:C2H2-type domain-containing protein n=1 Tax=Scylla paramamosain TaxID=85552 RepID=A0AAW0SVL0_SCYPA